MKSLTVRKLIPQFVGKCWGIADWGIVIGELPGGSKQNPVKAVEPQICGSTVLLLIKAVYPSLNSSLIVAQLPLIKSR